MSYATQVAQILLGLIFLVFGVNGFGQWIPIPKGTEAFEKAMASLMNAGSLMTCVKIFEALFGLLLIVGALGSISFLIHIGLIILAPIIFVIAYMQLTLNLKNGLGITALLLTLLILSLLNQPLLIGAIPI